MQKGFAEYVSDNSLVKIVPKAPKRQGTPAYIFPRNAEGRYRLKSSKKQQRKGGGKTLHQIEHTRVHPGVLTDAFQGRYPLTQSGALLHARRQSPLPMGGKQRSRTMDLKPLKGVFPLMPFVLDRNQDLDLDGLKKNIQAYEQAGVNGFVAFGCMGECYASSFDEFRKVVDTSMEATRNIATVFGITFHNTTECVRRAQYAEKAGADGVMAGSPYLIPCTDDAVYTHYREINDAVDHIQVMAYNNSH